MDVITAITSNWTHYLSKFHWSYLQSMPDDPLHLVVVTQEGDPPQWLNRIRDVALGRGFASVKFTPYVNMTGRLVYYDWLRSGLCALCELSEFLYIDADVDILRPLSYIPELDANADLFLAPDTMPNRFQKAVAKQYGLPKGLFAGMMYCRRSFSLEFNDVYRSAPLEFGKDIAPGQTVWNHIAGKYGAHFLSYKDHMNWYDEGIQWTNSLHFAGKLKHHFLCTKYEVRAQDQTIIIGTEPVVPDYFKEGYNGESVEADRP